MSTASRKFPKGHVNIRFANVMLILNKAYGDLSINAIGETKVSTINREAGLCPPGFVSNN